MNNIINQAKAHILYYLVQTTLNIHNSYFINMKDSMNLQQYPIKPQAPHRLSSGNNQTSPILENIWRVNWPYIAASIIAFFMLLFGLAVAALEAAGLDLGSSVAVTSVSIPVSSISVRTSNFNIGVGIWSGAIVAVAAIVIFVISEFY